MSGDVKGEAQPEGLRAAMEHLVEQAFRNGALHGLGVGMVRAARVEALKVKDAFDIFGSAPSDHPVGVTEMVAGREMREALEQITAAYSVVHILQGLDPEVSEAIQCARAALSKSPPDRVREALEGLREALENASFSTDAAFIDVEVAVVKSALSALEAAG